MKPQDNYLLTGLGASGNDDLYSVDECLKDKRYGNINDYPEIGTLVAEAQKEGYIGFFGYSRGSGAGSDFTAKFNVNCQQPTFRLAATCDKTSDVKPGDVLNFTVTATPDSTTSTGQELTTKSLELTKLKVNDTDIAVNDGDAADVSSSGTYSWTFAYTATAEDCASGSVTLSAEAAVTYGYTLNISDSSGRHAAIPTTSTITTTAGTECKIADRKGVFYKFTGDVPEVDGNMLTPPDGSYHFEGETVEIASYESKKVVTDQYIYAFDGWTLQDDPVDEGSSQTVTAEGLVFVGHWTRADNPKLTITKKVTGSSVEKNRKFTFTISINGGEEQEFVLADGESKEIMVPVGGSYVVTEKNPDAESASMHRYTTTDSEGGSSKATSGKDHVVEGSNLVEDKTITFTNDCKASPSFPSATPAAAAPAATPDTSDTNNATAMQILAAVGVCLVGVAVFMRFGKRNRK